MSEALITLIILGVTVVVFIWDRLPVMLVALAVPVALLGLATCLIAPWVGLVLLRHAKNVSPPAMRRWAYALYPLHFLLLLLIRQIIA